MRKDFDYYYNLYHNGNEKLYDVINISTIKELEAECMKNLAKYYEFNCWLIDMEEYYVDVDVTHIENY